MKIALTFCSDLEFKKGLDVLYKTLVYHNPSITKYDFVLMSDEIKTYKNFKIINYATKVKTHIKRFEKTFSKLKAFELEDYDRVVFFDSDIICLGDISLLTSESLSEYCFYAAKDDGVSMSDGDYINSGVMVINKPLLKKSTFLDLMSIAQEGFEEKKRDLNGNGSDQTVINNYLKKYNIRYGILETKYNTLKRLFFHHKEIWNNLKNEIRLLHFVGEKPWQKNRKEIHYKDIDNLWTKMKIAYI
jgi:lipopolysaccharide biosynthesis glycosyltransferase